MATVNLTKSPHTISFSRNPVVFRFRVSPYSDEDIFINTKVMVQLYAESYHYANDFIEIKSVILRPDKSGFIEQDWSMQLDSLVEFQTPLPTQMNAQVCKKQAVRYYLRYYIITDFEASGNAQTTSKFHIYKGGLSYPNMDAKRYFELHTSLGTSKSCLKFSCDEKIAPEAPLWLNVVLPGTTNELNVTIFHKFVDNSSTSVTINYPLNTTAYQNQIVCIPVGISSSFLDVDGWDTIAYLKYVVEDGGQVVGTTDWLTIDIAKRYDAINICYFNSLGNFDVLPVNGQIDLSGNYSKTDFTIFNSKKFATNGILEAELGKGNAKEQLKYKGETGFISLQKLNQLRDLLNAETAWLYTNKTLTPINVNAQNLYLYSNKDQLYSLALDWEIAFQDENFSPEGLVTAAATCPAVEYLNISQVMPNSIRVEWQLPEGFDLMELRYSNNGTLAANAMTNILLLNGNSGFMDITLPYISGNSGTSNIKVYARVVCSASSYGAWYGPLSMTYNRWAPPIARNDFATTFKGAASRQIYFNANQVNTIRSNDTAVNGGNIKIQSTSPLVGSAGGSISFTAIGVCYYTPPSGSFTGVEVFNYTIYEQMPLANSPTASAKIFVTVNANSIAGQNGTGIPFLKLSFENTVIQNSYIKADLRISFYKDAMGTIPYDLSGLGIYFQVQQTIEYLIAGAPVTSNLFSGSGQLASGTSYLKTGVFINEDNLFIGLNNKKSYSYSLISSNAYFII